MKSGWGGQTAALKAFGNGKVALKMGNNFGKERELALPQQEVQLAVSIQVGMEQGSRMTTAVMRIALPS